MAVNKKKVASMQDEDREFFLAAYKTNPAAKKAMDAEMKKLGMTPEQYFGIKKGKKTE